MDVIEGRYTPLYTFEKMCIRLAFPEGRLVCLVVFLGRRGAYLRQRRVAPRLCRLSFLSWKSRLSADARRALQRTRSLGRFMLVHSFRLCTYHKPGNMPALGCGVGGGSRSKYAPSRCHFSFFAALHCWGALHRLNSLSTSNRSMRLFYSLSEGDVVEACVCLFFFFFFFFCILVSPIALMPSAISAQNERTGSACSCVFYDTVTQKTNR
jgi:hypothetical protein